MDKQRMLTPNPRDGFDVALIPGKRERLAQAYAELRSTEHTVIANLAQDLSDCVDVESCPLCGADSANSELWLKVDWMPIVKCGSCDMLYGKTVLSAERNDSRYAENNVEQSYIRLKSNPEYAQLERDKTSYVMSRVDGLIPHRGKFLDIGAATGTLVRAAQDHGWSAFGIEGSPNQCIEAQRTGLNVQNGFFPDIIPKLHTLGIPTQFNAVSFFDVLEHVVSPLEFLSRVSDLIAPGGVMVVQVPNIDNVLIRLEGEKNSNICLGHWQYFTPKTLTAMLDVVGFEPLLLETYISELDRLVSYPHDRTAEVIAEIRPEAQLDLSNLNAETLHTHLLGYKLFGIYRKAL